MNQRGLLPLAFNNNTGNDRVNLSTVPRERSVIDENARSFFHTRGSTQDNALKRKRMEGNSSAFSSDNSFHSQKYQKPAKRKQDTTGFSMSSSDTFTRDFDENEDDLLAQQPPPSSPPRYVDDFSDDFMDETFVVEDPMAVDDAFLSQQTVVPTSEHDGVTQYPFKAISSDDNSVSMDWDRFGGVKIKHRHFQSSEPDIFSQSIHTKKNPLEVARELIDNTLFAGSKQLNFNFDSLGLTEIPDNIADVGAVVEGTEVQLHFPKNRLRTVNSKLFKAGKHLKVLSLRSNLLYEIPGNISKLTGLTYLSLIHNKLSFLPHNILHLNNLDTFTVRPNYKLLPVPEYAIAITHVLPDSVLPHKRRQYVTQLHWNTFSRASSSLSALMASTEVEGFRSMVPKLSELALRSMVKYMPMKREFEQWHSGLGRTLENRVVKAYATAFDGATCGECEKLTIEPVAEVMEWWEILEQADIPIKRKFCSGACAVNFQTRVINPNLAT
ncbi:hypothetical protein BABINDRAFT_161803 [Babjeviella inositovora NRRL Y-12698]|uniref:Uncharacterized protein n=1 Tax=Babjeviella inositovora NRRL Y-12698 TaxID=984486 RepID=A0A1E3QNW5_9ASCO|nr:uncharacterized protein BABINDRAFT_161803 [Babjeviella inositovora NRRL Y-12698]ODQ79399.1 hypothetical protein BABINDRAFT_161803 [Babjeviella inositovora NRRL Y-12698]